jgi:hypothetical protein
MFRRLTLRFFNLFLITSMSVTLLIGQSQGSSTGLKNAVVIERLTLPVNFDGIPDDEAWKAVEPLKFIMHSPVFGKEPTEETIARFAYDDKYLYCSAKLLYKDPGMIQSASLKRDYLGMGGDWFGVILDTYNDK